MPEEHPRPRWLAPLGALIAVVFLAGLFGAATRSLDAGPDHPDEWDPRVADLAAFVEEERGHEFDHPVYVDFLTPAEYTAITTEDDGGPSEEVERADFDDYAGQLRGARRGVGRARPLRGLQQRGRQRHARVLRPHRRAHPRPRHGDDRRPRGHHRPRAHPRAAGPALRPRPAERPDPRLRRLRRLPRAWARAMRSGWRTPTSRTSSPRPSRRSTTRSTPSELADSETATSDVPAVHGGGVRGALRARPALRHDAVQPGRQRRRRRRVQAAAGHRGAPPRPGQLPRGGERRRRVDDLDLESPKTPRSWRRDPSAPRRGTCSSPSGSIRRSPSRPPSAGTAMPSRPTRRTARCACKAVFVGDTDAEEDEMAAALDEWEAAMVGGQAEAIEVDGHPGIETCDPGEARRPRAHRPLRDVPLPSEPVGLPGRRCRVGARSRGQPLLRHARSWTT